IRRPRRGSSGLIGSHRGPPIVEGHAVVPRREGELGNGRGGPLPLDPAHRSVDGGSYLRAEWRSRGGTCWFPGCDRPLQEPVRWEESGAPARGWSTNEADVPSSTVRVSARKENGTSGSARNASRIVRCRRAARGI